MKVKFISIILLLSYLFIFSACSTAKNIDKKWDTINQEDNLIERPQSTTNNKYELLKDLNFSRGFSVSAFHANTSHGVPIGYFTYDDKKAEGDNIWSVAQWGCTENFLDADFTRTGNILKYQDKAKIIEMDATKTGNIKIGVKGSIEYGQDEEGNYKDRLSVTENWPHNIIGQTINSKSLSDSEKIIMQLEYTVPYCDRLSNVELDTSLHAAQFQWFITLSNANTESESYGQTMWFGFSMFDTRSIDKCPNGMAAYDGGKEDSTGLFIYMFSLDSVDTTKEFNEVTKPTSVINTKINVSVDIVPYINAALLSAQKKGALNGATIDDLIIGSTNIGWEIPGSYDVEVDINSLNMYKILK
jgi:hypothetical protein